MAKKEIKKEVSPTKVAKKTISLSKKGFIIGTVALSAVAAGGIGTSIYFGIKSTQNKVVESDNSITIEEANEFAKNNYKLTTADMTAKLGNATGCTMTWDFSKTKNLDNTSSSEYFMWHNYFWSSNENSSIFKTILSNDSFTRIKGEGSPVKYSTNEINSVVTSYQTKEGKKDDIKVWYAIDRFTIFDVNKEGTQPFASASQTNLIKKGDEITYTTRTDLGNSVFFYSTATLNKDGKVKKVSIDVNGYVGADSYKALFVGTFVADFTY